MKTLPSHFVVFLHVKDNNVVGAINNLVIESMPLEAFESQLQSSYCGLVSSAEHEIDQNQVKVFPNPFESTLNISSNFAIDKIEVINSTGALMLSKNKIEAATFTLHLDELSSGVYFVRLSGIKGESLRKKIIKI